MEQNILPKIEQNNLIRAIGKENAEKIKREFFETVSCAMDSWSIRRNGNVEGYEKKAEQVEKNVRKTFVNDLIEILQYN